jgi:hypothetical protein
MQNFLNDMHKTFPKETLYPIITLLQNYPKAAFCQAISPVAALGSVGKTYNLLNIT